MMPAQRNRMWIADGLVALAARRKNGEGQCPGQMAKWQHTGPPCCCSVPPHQLCRAAASLTWGLPPALPREPAPHFSPAFCPPALPIAVLPSNPALPCPTMGHTKTGPPTAPCPREVTGLGLCPARPTPQIVQWDRPWEVS